mgnify:FL=1
MKAFSVALFALSLISLPFLKQAEKPASSVYVSHFSLGYENAEWKFEIDYTLNKVQNKTEYPIRLLSSALFVQKESTISFSLLNPSFDDKIDFFSHASSMVDTGKYSKELTAFFDSLGFTEEKKISFNSKGVASSTTLVIDGKENPFGVYVPMLFNLQSTDYTLDGMRKAEGKTSDFQISDTIYESTLVKTRYFSDTEEFDKYRKENHLK